MKNVNHTKSKVGYVAREGYDGGFNYCPFCDDTNITSIEHLEEELIWEYDDEGNEISRKKHPELKYAPDVNYYNYCKDCKVVYDYGCLIRCECFAHYWNAHLISQYKFEGYVYDGMPMFDSVEEWLAMWSKVEVLQWTCPNKGITSTTGVPIDH